MWAWCRAVSLDFLIPKKTVNSSDQFTFITLNHLVRNNTLMHLAGSCDFPLQPGSVRILHSRRQVWQVTEACLQGAAFSVQDQTEQREYGLFLLPTCKTAEIYLKKQLTLLFYLRQDRYSTSLEQVRIGWRRNKLNPELFYSRTSPPHYIKLVLAFNNFQWGIVICLISASLGSRSSAVSNWLLERI